MNLKESRNCNIYNLQKCENYLSIKKDSLLKYLSEIEEDKFFINEISNQINFIRKKYGYRKGIFRKTKIKNIHEFSFLRILIYCIVRHFKPSNILETGVYYGGNTIFLLKALSKNKKGKLTAIDLPDKQIRKKFKNNLKKYRHPSVLDTEDYNQDLMPGFIVPQKYYGRYKLKIGEATSEIKKIKLKFDLYLHDSDHSYSYLLGELNAAEKKLSKKSLIIVDDIDWSNAFYAHVCKKKYFPMIFSDNGKDNLRSRIGLIKKNHKLSDSFNYTK
jgi:predicted O-methyltransferase YrrM